LFIKIWNFLRGYVIIEVKGFSVERFVNQAIASGLIFWDLERDGGKFYAKVTRRDFFRAVSLCEKTGTHITALRFYGLPVLMRWAGTRPVLLGGAVAFVVGMVVITSFIWRIDIEGTARIDAADILAFLEANDTQIGTSRRAIHYRTVENMLMLEFEDIAWTSVSVSGTRLLVRITETICTEQLPAVDYEFQDIVATRDGVIVYMVTEAGEPKFRPGDVVHAGDVVVSGRLTLGSAEDGNLSYRYVAALSEVWARVYYTMEFEIPLTYYEKSFTGVYNRVYSITIGSRTFTLPFVIGPNQDFIYYETTTRHHRAALGADYPLPLALTRQNTYELTRHLRSRSEEVASHMAIELATRRIADEMQPDAEILEKQISFEMGERALLATVFLVTIQRIDQTQELTPEEIEMEE